MAETKPRRAFDVFRAFLFLGLTSFGGPVAHLGFFQTYFVERHRWIDQKTYGDLVALCQFLPGPASSQVGLAIGLRQCGIPGGIAAFLGFTLPSFIIMVLAGYGVSYLSGPWAGGLIHGLKLAAVAIVAQAIWSMGRAFCPDLTRLALALSAALVLLLAPSSFSQILVILGGGLAGFMLLNPIETGAGPTPAARHKPANQRSVRLGLGLFVVILLVSPILVLVTGSQALALFDAFYRTGSLVFGGGHVVLPLLEREVVAPGWVSADQFLAGYGIAQAIPGPLFTFAGFLGTVSDPQPNGLAGALLAVFAIFLPSFLLVTGTLPVWDRLRGDPRLQTAMMGTNAAVVGLLAAAFIDPVWTGAVHDGIDAILAIMGFALLARWACSPLVVVAALAISKPIMTLLLGSG